MGYTIYLGTFDKRLNSTARPTLIQYQAWDSYTVVLKEESTSYDHPTFVLSAEFATVANKHYNYCIAFGRWYWVTDLRAIRTGLIEIDVSLDILATFQGAIKGTKAFIEYGFNTTDAGDSSTRIADARRPVSKNPTIATASAAFVGALSSAGSYILQVVGATNGVSCYAVTYTQLQAIMLSLQTDLENDIDTITANVDPADAALNLATLVELMGAGYKRSLLAESAMAAIKSIHWLPLAWSSISGTSAQIYLGSYATGQYGTRLNNNDLWTNSVTLSIPWQANDWKRCNSQMSLYIPFFGTVPVPVDQCLNQASLTATLSLDVLSGDLSVRVVCGSQTIYTGSTNIAAPYAVGVSAVTASAKLSGGIEATTGAMQMAAGVVDAGAGIVGALLGVGGGGISAGIQSMASGAQSARSGYAQTVQPLITSAGSMGGIAALGQSTNLILTMIYWPAITDTDFEALYGHPVFKVDNPVNGFCKTRGFSISLANEATYAAYINTVMDGGCFIED